MCRTQDVCVCIVGWMRGRWPVACGGPVARGRNTNIVYVAVGGDIHRPKDSESLALP